MPSMSVLPMQLQVGDRFTDDRGEWQIAGRPYSTASGKLAHARVRKVGEPAVIEERTWSAFERVAVRRGADTPS
jgi:hypothetical protein